MAIALVGGAAAAQSRTVVADDARRLRIEAETARADRPGWALDLHRLRAGSAQSIRLTGARDTRQLRLRYPRATERIPLDVPRLDRAVHDVAASDAQGSIRAAAERAEYSDRGHDVRVGEVRAEPSHCRGR